MSRLAKWITGSIVGLGAMWLIPLVPSVPESPAWFIWAWERPEDLRFLAPTEAGVALFAGTLHLAGDWVLVRPRLQSIAMSRGVECVPVVRVVSDAANPPSLDEAQVEKTVTRLLGLFADWPADEVQIDFDARVSERLFYRRVLEKLRGRLGAGSRISITALASWCLGDPWIADLPIDDAVPMLFRMGTDGPGVRRFLASGGDFHLEVCRSSLGISTDEPLVEQPLGRRTFVFHPRPWDETAYREKRERLRS